MSKQATYEPRPETVVTQGDLDEALALLRGSPVLAIELPSPHLIREGDGTLRVKPGSTWVKLSVAFRDVMPQLKGAPLAVFLCICLHVNSNGESWPNYDTICKETGYERQAVAKAIQKLKTIPGLLDILQREGTSNLYRPAFISYGSGDPLSKSNYPPYEKQTDPPIKSKLKVEPLSRTKKESKQPTAANPPAELLLASTPVGKVLHLELEAYYASRGRRAPMYYKSPQQRDAYLAAFNTLGSEAAPLITKGISRERVSLPSMLAWLETCARNKRNGPPPTQAGRQAEPAGPWRRS